MRLSKHRQIAVAIVCLTGGLAPGQPALTICNQNFAFVREPLTFHLRPGTNEVSVTNMTARMEPDSVILRDHTPKDETVRVYTGDAFDLVGERRRTSYQIDTTRNRLDESFEIKLHNRKQEGTVEIRVVEHLYRWINWENVEKFDPFLKTDSQPIELRIRVPAGEEKTVTYKVHCTW